LVLYCRRNRIANLAAAVGNRRKGIAMVEGLVAWTRALRVFAQRSAAMAKGGAAILATLAVVLLPGGLLVLGAFWLYRCMRLSWSRAGPTATWTAAVSARRRVVTQAPSQPAPGLHR
jgi:hypothetical protein